MSFFIRLIQEMSATVRKGKYCIIHKEGLKIDDDHLISPQTYDSWATLLEAAEIRKHEALLQIARNAQEGEVPEIFYHRKCRSAFTIKRDLESLKRKRALEEDAHEDETLLERPKKRSATSASRVYYKECIFCERPKYVNRTLEKLVIATQLRVDQSLRQIATERCDERILAITSRDIVAAEAHYHRTCYRDYTRPTPQQHPEESEPKNDAEYDAVSDLFSFIRNDVLDAQVVVTMIELIKKVESFL